MTFNKIFVILVASVIKVVISWVFVIVIYILMENYVTNVYQVGSVKIVT